MNFDSIKSIIDKNNWHKPNEDNHYISKDDIYLSFDIVRQLPKGDTLPENVSSFREKLEKKCDIDKIDFFNVTFEYNSVKLENLPLYNFIVKKSIKGKLEVINVYFSRHLSEVNEKAEVDMFSLALYNVLNDTKAMDLIKEVNKD